MGTAFKWIRRVVELVLVVVVAGVLINLFSEEIRLDEQGWLHAVRNSRYVPWLVVIILLVTLFEVIASFREKRQARIAIEVTKHRFCGSGWAGDMPLPPLKFEIFLDIRNTGQESGYINQFDLVEADLGTDLLTVSNAVPSCHATGGITGGRRLDWPEEIEERVPRVRCNIEIRLNVRDPEVFARRLSELTEYRLVLRYIWERSDGATSKKTITVQGNYDDFKAHCIDSWEQRNHAELALAATRGELDRG
jgi:hypothetical protein